MMYYKEFYPGIRDFLKDEDAEAEATISPDALARTCLKGIQRIQNLFPETRMDRTGRMAQAAATAYTETQAKDKLAATGDYPVLPLPDEFIPALEAYVLAWAFGRDSSDVKDESLARHWNNRFADLAGIPRL